MSNDSISIPTHLLGIEWIGDIAGKPVFAKTKDAGHVRNELRNLKQKLYEELIEHRKEVCEICAKLAEEVGSKEVAALIRKVENVKLKREQT